MEVMTVLRPTELSTRARAMKSPVAGSTSARTRRRRLPPRGRGRPPAPTVVGAPMPSGSTARCRSSGPRAPDRHRRWRCRPRCHRPPGRGSSTGRAPRSPARSRAPAASRDPGRPPRTDHPHRPPPAHRRRSGAAARCCRGTGRPRYPRRWCHCRGRPRPRDRCRTPRSPGRPPAAAHWCRAATAAAPAVRRPRPRCRLRNDRPCIRPSTPRTTTRSLPMAAGERISELMRVRQSGLPSASDNAITSPLELPMTTRPKPAAGPPDSGAFTSRRHSARPLLRSSASTAPLWLAANARSASAQTPRPRRSLGTSPDSLVDQTRCSSMRLGNGSSASGASAFFLAAVVLLVNHEHPAHSSTAHSSASDRPARLGRPQRRVRLTSAPVRRSSDPAARYRQYWRRWRAPRDRP